MRGQGTIRLALAFAALLASLTLVISRQSHALDLLRSLDGARAERALIESRRASLLGQAQRLEGRARIRLVAERRMGMRVPTGADLVTLRRSRPSESRPDGLKLAVGGGE